MSFYEKLITKNNSPLVMGIVNLTPDSFYDGNNYNNLKTCIKYVKKIVQEGVDIIDLGACSSRPGSLPISLKEEENRLFPVLEKIKEVFPNILISIDTYRYQIAKKAIENGAELINDIYLKKDKKEMFSVIQKFNTPYILMHMLGRPQNMQKNINYINFNSEIISFFKKYISELNKIGFNNIILDPGFGFGKTVNQNYQLINMLPKIKELGYPVMTGVSRKSMINKPLGHPPQDSLHGTIAANTICLMKGADIIRVHDVKAAKEAIKIFNLTKENN